METIAKNKLYEGMFLVDSSKAGADWDGITATIRTILEKAGAEIDSIRKWDDRRLAYDIKGKSRGTYILSYFRVDGGRIQDIEKAVRLSEKIMRVLILSAERLSQEDIEKDTPATKVEMEKEKRKAAQEAVQEDEAEQLSAPEEVEEAEGVEQTEDTKQFPEEKTEDSQESEVSMASEVRMAPEVSMAPEISTVVDDLREKQPEHDQIEGSEQADEQEQRQP